MGTLSKMFRCQMTPLEGIGSEEAQSSGGKSGDFLPSFFPIFWIGDVAIIWGIEIMGWGKPCLWIKVIKIRAKSIDRNPIWGSEPIRERLWSFSGLDSDRSGSFRSVFSDGSTFPDWIPAGWNHSDRSESFRSVGIIPIGRNHSDRSEPFLSGFPD